MNEKVPFLITSEESQTPDPGTMPLMAWATQTIDVIQSRLTTLFQTIRHDVGPNARVLVVGYPDILPTGAGSPTEGLCNPLLHTFGPSFRKNVRFLQVKLNKAIETAAREQVGNSWIPTSLGTVTRCAAQKVDGSTPPIPI